MVGIALRGKEISGGIPNQLWWPRVACQRIAATRLPQQLLPLSMIRLDGRV
jgi:hypothetical protein